MATTAKRGVAAEVADVEKGADYAHLTNDVVESFSWEDVTVSVKDRKTKMSVDILDGISGFVEAGEMLALMGPSGSGKTTLLNVLAHRAATPNATIQQTLCINGTPTSLASFRKLSSYVEQDDALVGSLTVRETLYFAAQLALPSSINKTQRKTRIEGLLSAFGLQNQADTIIGTPIRKGVSGGQKRRVSVASQLITSPKIVFLDEPTSGLDSAASYEVMSFVRDVARKHKVLVIASIHQPSTTTFELFDKLMLLSRGKVAYNGPVKQVVDYFGGLGYNMPMYTNPAEYLIQLVNTDFSQDQAKSNQQLAHLHTSWADSPTAAALTAKIHSVSNNPAPLTPSSNNSANPLLIPLTLIHRSFIKSYRDVVAYGIRIAMYMGLAIMMGTVWLRLSPTQANIQAFTNAIFFGGAFMSFMAVAYIPAYIEDLHLYTKERANGLYGPTAFMVANFVIGIPYLFLITILFSVIAYWLGNFQPSATGFWTWVMWLFLDLLAAESLVVLLSSLIPIFVVALAATAFANGLWMCVNGFMVQPETLNAFWRYVFHYIDYQAYVFRGMMVNEFGNRNFSCARTEDGGCQCMYPSALQDQCLIEGKAVLSQYGYGTGNVGRYVGYMVVIVFVYRVLGWLVLFLRKH
ncbi:ATP-binding cassette transporter-like protein [Dothidotthia symphoricarpi CBS 119687]|uniref:ATP-binding cassette transporter-like protein n=1 Tax=Dothidotthia symphoricarpi CBS 119687 TaxID=1392245 RepID=A0A6A6ACF5_9PLEO|nr:ATP-binding cassette transporter-like protein [Dothidotthia symphoricarpi CBS 119687]KAF2128401.1 ATP-binding cassette transporter-like protein [Dothidotthia symphoricarpi CBS 119687]